MRATVCDATSVSAVITDTTAGGARFGVWVNTSNVSDPRAPSVPNLRVATFFSSEGVNLSYALASRSAIKQACVTYTLQLLIEPAFIQDYSPDHVLTVEGLQTDGHLIATPEPAVRRSIEILGDSLTAGYGAGFDLPHSQSKTCGGGGLTDDQGVSYGALLCANFSARCTMEASLYREGLQPAAHMGLGTGWHAPEQMAQGQHGTVRCEPFSAGCSADQPW